MHAQVIINVKLDAPLDVVDAAGCRRGRAAQGEVARGYLITCGVNAADCADAVSLAAADWAGNREAPRGEVVAIEAESIDAAQWPKEVVSRSGPMDRRGVYYRSGLVYYTG